MNLEERKRYEAIDSDNYFYLSDYLQSRLISASTSNFQLNYTDSHSHIMHLRSSLDTALYGSRICTVECVYCGISLIINCDISGSIDCVIGGIVGRIIEVCLRES